jgi:hypothetical protein
MKLLKPSLLLTALLALCAAAHAEVVGRVLMTAGDTSLIRNNRELRVAVGTPVEDKDTLKTGTASNMQVRFTDESIVSLRDQSLLKIDEYQFTGKQHGMEKALFNLVKGGFRTITGLIGRVNKTNYGVKTATATIGIRGTHFALLLCTAGSCGAAAKDGVYGGVSGGIIAATNNTGEYQFGSGDYFYAPSKDSPVKKLIGPPGFFADHLAGQKRGVKPPSGTGNEQTQYGGYASDGSPNFYSVLFASLVQPPPSPVYVVTENTRADGSSCVLPGSSLCSVPGIPVISTTSGGPVVLELAWATPGFSDTVQAIQPQDTVTLTGSLMTAYSVSSNGSDGILGSGSVADQGSDPVGNMFWGRWVSGTSTTVTDISGNTFTPAPGVPYIYGNPATSVPTSSTVVFSFAGGPNPIDASGTVGTITSGGSLSVDFLARNVSMASPLQFNMGPVNYNMNTLNASYPSATQPQITGNLSGTCSGGTCATTAAATGPVSAHFTGATGAGLGIALATVITSPAPSVALAVGYKCPTC